LLPIMRSKVGRCAAYFDTSPTERPNALRKCKRINFTFAGCLFSYRLSDGKLIHVFP
jgi:hypothetical protein